MNKLIQFHQDHKSCNERHQWALKNKIINIMYNIRVNFYLITINVKYVWYFLSVTCFVVLMICENYGSNKTITNCMCSITHTEWEEHRITGHVLGANSYWIPSSLIKYDANSINLLKREYYNTIINQKKS